MTLSLKSRDIWSDYMPELFVYLYLGILCIQKYIISVGESEEDPSSTVYKYFCASDYQCQCNI